MLRFATYNCNSVRKNIESVRDLLKNNDIVFLQEIMLLNDDLYFLDLIDNDFICTAKVKDEYCNGIATGRPSAGVAIFYRKSYLNLIQCFSINECLNGIIIDTNIGKILALNVYLPYDNRDLDSLDKFRMSIATIGSVIDEYNIVNIVIAGDMNADPSRGRFWRELTDLISNYNLKTDLINCPSDTFTYLSPAHDTTSWLDHVFTTQKLYENMVNINVNYDLSLYDHFPIEFSFSKINIDKYKDNNSAFDITSFVKWDKMKSSDYLKYSNNVRFYLVQHKINDTLNCNNIDCKNKSHILKLDELFELSKEILLKSSDEFSYKFDFHPKCVPGWNDHVKYFYNKARECFKIWKENGKLRSGNDYLNMKQTRTEFKHVFNECKRNEEQIRNNKMAESLIDKNSKEFWNQVRSKKGKNKIISNCINNCINPEEQVECFSNVFKSVFSKNKSDSLDDDFNFNRDNNCCIKFSSKNIIDSISKLKSGIGPDNIHSNHFKYAPHEFYLFLSNLFSSFMNHSHIPLNMNKGLMIPLIKDKYGDLTSTKNYRPITNSSMYIKLFEYILYDKLKMYLDSSEHQHGYKSNCSTSTAFLTLKETIQYYNNQGSPVYVAFFDLTKAFDNVSHSIMFSKLKQRNVPKPYLSILQNMYNNQYINVKYNGHLSKEWKVFNGVKQGGILSPYFFNVYIDDLIEKISKNKNGCKLGIISSNIIGYADDICLLAPSINSLQNLINLFEKEIEELKLNINLSKCFGIKFYKNGNLFVNNSILLKNNFLSFKEDILYLGFFIQYNLVNKLDIIRERNKFYKVFNSIIRKFIKCDLNVKLKIFETNCLQFYGSTFWSNLNLSKGAYKQFEVGYHKAVKKILNIPYYESNHLACQSLGLLTFNHLINLHIIRFIKSIYNNKCKFLNKCMFSINLQILKDGNNILKNIYGVDDILVNDFIALKSRLFFIFNLECQTRHLN